MSRRSYDGKETSGRENGAGGAVFYTGSAEDMTDQQCHQFAHSLRNKMEELRLNTRVCHEYRKVLPDDFHREMAAGGFP